MYPIERALKKLRASVRNKARVEGCIAEAFALKDISQFSTRYFAQPTMCLLLQCDFMSKMNRPKAPFKFLRIRVKQLEKGVYVTLKDQI
jgi:hypothetical protein